MVSGCGRSSGVRHAAVERILAGRQPGQFAVHGREARGEAIETDELGVPHGPVENVARLSVGAIRDWRINDNAVFGVGALVQTHLAPSALEPSYGGDPEGGMAFVRLKIG